MHNLNFIIAQIDLRFVMALKIRKRQQGIIGLIKKSPKITVEEMAERLNVNERTIHRDMEDLKDIVKHVGSTKGGHWVITR
ncbi:MAG: HTH domain-containing protein [Tyzzerella sp.]|nr:HTH domain-containing protein [Tyzzerella sp.]